MRASPSTVTRRAVLLSAGSAAAAVALSGCMTADTEGMYGTPSPVPVAPGPASPDYASIYAAVTDAGYQLPAIPFDRLDRRLLRQEVADPTGEAPGTIVVDTLMHHLYLVQPGGRAMRYGVSLGKAGFEWSGNAVVQWKKQWPTWTPPPEMIARRPELERYSAANGGMPPGPLNPLGARALYIFRDGRDTMYRLHGTPEWNSIGTNASSGCVRLMNQDVIDLYQRVSGVTPIIVRGAAMASMRATSASATGEAIDSGVPEGAERLE